MFKDKIVLLVFLSLSLFISSCGDDDTPDYNYPIRVTFQGAVDKEPMVAYANTGGTVAEISLDETDLDDDELFAEVDTDPSFDVVTFISDTEVQLFNEDDLFFQDTFTATYAVDGEDIKITIDLSAFGSPFSFNANAIGTLESFKISSQAYVEKDGNFTLGTQQFYQDNINTLTSLLEEDASIVILNYNQEYD